MSVQELKTKVTPEALQQVQDFLKLPPGIDESILKMDILAARRKVMTSVGEDLDDFYDDNAIFQAAVMLDAATLYNNRNEESPSATFEYKAYPYMINSMKDEYRVKEQRLTNQLKSDHDDIVDMYGSDDDSSTVDNDTDTADIDHETANTTKEDSDLDG